MPTSEGGGGGGAGEGDPLYPLLHLVGSHDHPSLSDDLNPSDAEVTYGQCKEKQKEYENYLNPVMLVFIEKLLLITMR